MCEDVHPFFILKDVSIHKKVFMLIHRREKFRIVKTKMMSLSHKGDNNYKLYKAKSGDTHEQRMQRKIQFKWYMEMCS